MKPTEELVINYIKSLTTYHSEKFTIDYIDDSTIGGLNVRISSEPFNYKENFRITYLELLTFIYKQLKQL